MSTPESFSQEPDALLPENYEVTLTQSFAAMCGLTALHLALSDLTPESQKQIKESILHTWKSTWQETFQKDMTRYMNVLDKVKNGDRIPQPEDYQLGFNRAMKIAERVARTSLRMEENN